MAENARSYFRLQYPASARPRVVVADRAFAVLDLSEGGVKFATSDGFAPSDSKALEDTSVHNGFPPVDARDRARDCWFWQDMKSSNHR